MSPKNYLIRTAALFKDALTKRPHPLDPSCERYIRRLGDETGLTKTGVHFCRVLPNTTSTVQHWHSHDDEWIYIIDAGPNATLLIREGEGADAQTVKLSKGDFLGFPAGVQNAHAMQSGDEELVYLVGGSRVPVDVCHYPERGLTAVIDKTGEKWAVEDAQILTEKTAKAAGRPWY